MLDEASRDQKQKVATGFIRDELHAQDFAGPISLRASKVLGPNRRRVAEILRHLKLLSRASLGSLLVFCASFAMGYARLKDFTLRVMNKCVGLDVRMNPALTALPRRNHLQHDLFTQVFLRSLQYGIVVMGFIDAFVDAHHQHRRDIENPGNFGDCMKGRIRFMTAITPAYAHAY